MPADRLQGMSADHIFGTDRYGRDTFTWIMYGARITLLVGVVSVAIAAFIGVPLGVLAGMTPYGWLSGLIMRGNDLLLAFPALLLAIVFSAVFGPGTGPAMVALGIASIPGFARVARSGTLQVMSTEYIMAARAANRRIGPIAVFHVLPNIAGMIIVQAQSPSPWRSSPRRDCHSWAWAPNRRPHPGAGCCRSPSSTCPPIRCSPCGRACSSPPLCSASICSATGCATASTRS